MSDTTPIKHRSQLTLQFIVTHDIEFVTVDRQTTYLVDRGRQQLRNVDDDADVLQLEQRQVAGAGRGELEVLERYVATDDPERSVILDSSPDFLASLKSR